MTRRSAISLLLLGLLLAATLGSHAHRALEHRHGAQVCPASASASVAAVPGLALLTGELAHPRGVCLELLLLGTPALAAALTFAEPRGRAVTPPRPVPARRSPRLTVELLRQAPKGSPPRRVAA